MIFFVDLILLKQWQSTLLCLAADIIYFTVLDSCLMLVLWYKPWFSSNKKLGTCFQKELYIAVNAVFTHCLVLLKEHHDLNTDEQKIGIHEMWFFKVVMMFILLRNIYNLITTYMYVFFWKTILCAKWHSNYKCKWNQ